MAADPAVDPHVMVCDLELSNENPPVPVQVNPVMVAMLKIVTVLAVYKQTILAMPKLMARVFELLELKMPVVKLNPFRFKVPDVSVVVAFATTASAPPRVTVPEAAPLLIVKAAIVLLLDVNVPLPT